MNNFETKRLGAERINPKHFADLRVMHPDPVVMATLGGIRSEQSTTEYLKKQLDHWNQHDFGLWIFRNSKKQFIGLGGIRHLPVDGVDEIELAYSLMNQYWNKGYATEIANALLDKAHNQFKIDGMIAVTTPDNIASRRVMEKMEFRFERDVLHHETPCVLYRQANNIRLQP